MYFENSEAGFLFLFLLEESEHLAIGSSHLGACCLQEESLRDSRDRLPCPVLYAIPSTLILVDPHWHSFFNSGFPASWIWLGCVHSLLLQIPLPRLSGFQEPSHQMHLTKTLSETLRPWDPACTQRLLLCVKSHLSVDTPHFPWAFYVTESISSTFQSEFLLFPIPFIHINATVILLCVSVCVCLHFVRRKNKI